MAKNMIETPPALVLPTLSLLLIYWSIGFSKENNPEEFFQILFAGFLLINCAIGYGYFISATFTTIETATNIAPLFLMPCLLFGGFFINSSSYPWWLAWVRFTSPVYYANCAILIA
jgi:ABC-type multidrug transport system permease subunit